MKNSSPHRTKFKSRCFLWRMKLVLTFSGWASVSVGNLMYNIWGFISEKEDDMTTCCGCRMIAISSYLPLSISVEKIRCLFGAWCKDHPLKTELKRNLEWLDLERTESNRLLRGGEGSPSVKGTRGLHHFPRNFTSSIGEIEPACVPHVEASHTEGRWFRLRKGQIVPFCRWKIQESMDDSSNWDRQFTANAAKWGVYGTKYASYPWHCMLPDNGRLTKMTAEVWCACLATLWTQQSPSQAMGKGQNQESRRVAIPPKLNAFLVQWNRKTISRYQAEMCWAIYNRMLQELTLSINA